MSVIERVRRQLNRPEVVRSPQLRRDLKVIMARAKRARQAGIRVGLSPYIRSLMRLLDVDL